MNNVSGLAGSLPGLIPAPAAHAGGRADVAADRRHSPFVVEERVFRDALSRERKRSDRFEQRFVLALVAFSGAGSAEAWEPVIHAVSAARRDADVLGWFTHAQTLGVICPHLDASATAETTQIEERIHAELVSRLDAAAHARCSVRLYAHHGLQARVSAPPSAGALDPDADTLPRRTRETAKRVLDVVGSLALMLLLAPLFAFVALLVKSTSRGPVLFRQERVGRYGVPFTMLKFRTMRAGADEAIHQQYITGFIRSGGRPVSLGDEAVFKMVNDPRVTRVGRWLRRTSLDELPQFWNVLRGEMSLVGPRPPLEYEVAEYKSWHIRRVFEAKPGITGLWQVTARSRTGFDDSVRLDLRYAKNPSLLTDLRILAATPRAVISRKGAC